MDEDRLHVVFGTGQVGSALAAHLARQGIAVRAVSRNRFITECEEKQAMTTPLSTRLG